MTGSAAVVMLATVHALAVLVVAAIVSGAGAGVATAAPSTPAPGALVASDGRTRLTVHDEHRRLCLGLGREPDSFSSCGEDDAGVVTIGTPSGAASRRYLGAAVPAAATSVEVRRAGSLVVAGPTVAGERYEGRRAGKVRFVLLRLPDGTREDGLRVRAVDAGGMPVEVLAPGDGELTTDRRSLLSGRSGRTRWAVTSQRSSSLASALFDLDHETVTRCLEITVDSPRDSNRTGGQCTGGTPQDQALGSLFAAFGAGEANTQEACGPQFRLLHGSVPGDRARVSALLGNGRRVEARTALFVEADRTVFALVVPGGAAIRSLRVVRPGIAPRTVAFSVAPLSVTCATGTPSFNVAADFDPAFDILDQLDSLPSVTPTEPVTSVGAGGTGGIGFRVADGPAGSLCVAVGHLPFTAVGCGVVTPGYGETIGTLDSFHRPRAFVVAVPAEVARIRLGPKGGPSRELPTVTADGYAGRYAGRVRFLAASIAGLGDLNRMEFLDAAGRVLHTETDDTTPTDLAAPKVSPPRRRAGSPGRPSLWQTTITRPDTTGRCLALTPGPPPTARTRCRAIDLGTGTVVVAASCATHRLTVAVLAAPGSRVVVSTGAGAPQGLPLHAGAGVLSLPAGRGLRSLHIARPHHRALRIPVHAPPATQQCGWSATPPPANAPESGGSAIKVVLRRSAP